MGTKFTIGGEEYDAPPLNFKALKKCWPASQKVMAAISKGEGNLTPEESLDVLDAAVVITQAAIEKNYPEMTKERVEEELMAHELMELQPKITELMIASGLLKAAAPGKSKAVKGKKAKPSAATSTASSAS